MIWQYSRVAAILNKFAVSWGAAWNLLNNVAKGFNTGVKEIY